ncbi:DedA family protein [Rothia mucilaginosa]|uniref:Membrane-associated protein n=1 Tax=Rothia mucilaginosa TaxID=43675 RepID=A0A0K2S0Y2_9MICC|nr:VTT domain-containing protein [Rothia mucilaginosa]BAS20482.1 membrane-associated protein [Rothia mucilaginosa]
MKEWFDALPIEVALAFMWVVGIVRTSIVYALGALAAEGGARLDRIRKAMDSPLYRKARRLINRWGVIAVPLCFLTVGLQTAVIITTGFTKMPLRRWVPAMLLGTFIWACIYTTIGFAILAALGLEPWMFPLALAIVITVLVIVSQLRERRINRETVANATENIVEN